MTNYKIIKKEKHGRYTHVTVEIDGRKVVLSLPTDEAKKDENVIKHLNRLKGWKVGEERKQKELMDQLTGKDKEKK